ncbi:MAG: hypothetical protein K0R14_2136 [Burkholderiales bacterium]|nr:hypothetical protein [Burkholderiales bacterium]
MKHLKLVVILFGILCSVILNGYSSSVGGNSAQSVKLLTPTITSDFAWGWIGGSQSLNQGGIYNGIDSAPSTRWAGVNWMDASGSLWLFGGAGYGESSGDTIGYLNALWRYNPSTNQWALMSGSNVINESGVYGTQGKEASTNMPGARGMSVSWADTSGNLWLFGGFGYDSNGSLGALNDLWKYNLSTNQWTWMSGSNVINQSGVYGDKGEEASTNVPGARYDSVSWVDGADNLWLFGGESIIDKDHAGELNDLWKYNPSTNQWTWMSGSNVMNQRGVYGNKGEEASTNMPGARFSSVSWTDTSGNLWLFGGGGYDSVDNLGLLNDLWKYNTVTNQWTWISGSQVSDQRGVYGNKGEATSTTVPGARYISASWTDASNNLWLFGGEGYSDLREPGYLNDTWKYSMVTNQWTWISGSKATDETPVIYGPLNDFSTDYNPGTRSYPFVWADPSGSNLWLFGGYGYNNNHYSDLWMTHPH